MNELQKMWKVKMCATTYSQTSVHKIKKLHVHHFTPTAHHSLWMMNLEQLFWKSAICLLCWGKACMWGRTWRHTGGRGRQGFTVQWAASLQSPATEGDRHTHALARWRLHYIFYHRDYAKLHLRNLIREQTVIIHTLERWCNISAVYNVNWWGPYSTNETPKTLNEHLIGVRLSWFNRSLSYRWLCQIGTPVDSFSSLKTLKLIFTQVGERPAGWESWILQSFYKWIHRNSKHLRPDFKFITCLMWKWSNNSFCSLNVCMRVNLMRSCLCPRSEKARNFHPRTWG